MAHGIGVKVRNPKVIIVSAVALLVLLVSTSAIYAGGGDSRTYEVTITKLTLGQPLTPPVLAAHKNKAEFFTVGDPASVGIHHLAENGGGAWLVAALANDVNVFDIVQGTAPIVPAGDPGSTGIPSSAVLSITTDKGAKRLSFVSMLICTNDGFTGNNSLKLPKKVGDVVNASSNGYDAGTEMNTEDFADLVPPCQPLVGIGSPDTGTGVSNPALAEGGIVTVHPGVAGIDDLVPAVHGWTDPVASITIERIS